jgi:hypothetical protein
MKIVDKIKQSLRQMAAVLAGMTAGWTTFQKKMATISFLLVFCGFSLFVLIQGLAKKSAIRPGLLIQKISVPAASGKSLQRIPESGISEDLLRRIETLKSNDSLLKARPQLLDSIETIEKFYQSAIKK